MRKFADKTLNYLIMEKEKKKFDERVDKRIFRLRVKEILKKQGRTQSSLASDLGMSVGNLSGYLCGHFGVSIPRLVDIAKALNVEFCDLFARTGWCDGSIPEDYYEDGISLDYESLSSDDKVVIIREKSEKNFDGYVLTESSISSVSHILRCEYSRAKKILMSLEPVTPKEYSLIAYALGNIAHIVMPDILVTYDYELLDRKYIK